jgi:adenylate cyclase, class 2
MGLVGRCSPYLALGGRSAERNARVRYTNGSRRRGKAGRDRKCGVAVAQETEIKLKVTDEKAFHRALKKLKAEPASKDSPRVHEFNVMFDHPDGALAKRGQLLRVRTETAEPPKKKAKGKNAKFAWKQRVLVTFKRPTDEDDLNAPSHTSGRVTGHYKIREELELEISDAGALTKIFEGLGMDGWFRYEKYRTTYKLGKAHAWAKDLLIELDETPVGLYVELEGPIEAIDRAAEALGFTKRDYIAKSYLALYVEECRKQGEQPRHMLFPPPKVRGK